MVYGDRLGTALVGPSITWENILLMFLAASTECSAGSNDHFVVLVVVVVVVLGFVQYDGRPLGGANFQY
jgi:hypothetical protein